MKTLALSHGDLVISGDGGYQLVSGAPRIRQDLTLALSEEYGTDRFHPGYGSIVTNYLGRVITPDLQQLVRAEVNRVLQNYLITQQNEVLRGTYVDIKGRYDTRDVVRSVDDITVRTFLDAIYVTATLTTLARETITIARAVS
jgi:phage baseplate assembly protein W